MSKSSGNDAAPRGGLFARLLRRKTEPSDAFGQEPEAPEDPFGIGDDAQEARFRRQRRLMAAGIILLLLGGGGGAGAYFWLRPEGGETAAPATEAEAEHGNRVVQLMPPEPGPENLTRALIHPPGSVTDNPDAARRQSALPTHPPQPAAPEQTAPETPEQTASAPPPTEAKPAAEPAPPPVPTVAEPGMPTPRADRDTPSKPPKFADLPKPATPPQPLAKAPIADLQRRTPAGLTLPAVGADGRRPWRVYGRPFTGKPQIPRIAVIVRVGLSAAATRAATDSLPPDVTLAFDVDSPHLREELAAARAAGHETMLELGMEAATFPAVDPGPSGLLTALTADKNRDRLDQALARGDAYIGLLARGGERYAASVPHFAALMQDLSRMGIAYVASGRAAPFETVQTRPAHATVDTWISADSFRERIAARLQQAEATARARGSAVVAAEATPLTLSMLLSWAASLPRNSLQLAPVSAVVKE